MDTSSLAAAMQKNRKSRCLIDVNAIDQQTKPMGTTWWISNETGRREGGDLEWGGTRNHLPDRLVS